jgi:protein dithiol oxidoreductase (disulfide-forming)
MNLNRRTLSLAVSALFASSALPAWAQAPAGVPLQEGKNFQTLKPRQEVLAGAGKIEITEFFWYGCPHCNSIDQPLHDWLKKQGADVVLRRAHIDFGERTEAHQRLFYTLEAMGELAKQHSAVFTAIHGEKKNLGSKAQVLDWAKSRGMDMAKFEATYSSFSMATTLNRSKQLMADYKVEGVPHFAIDGRFITSPSIAGGSPANFFGVMESLIVKVRADRKPDTKPAGKPAAKPAAKPAVKPAS